MMSINLNVIAILNIHSVDYHYIIHRISKSEAVNLQQNADLSEKKQEIIKNIFSLSCIKDG